MNLNHYLELHPEVKPQLTEDQLAFAESMGESLQVCFNDALAQIRINLETDTYYIYCRTDEEMLRGLVDVMQRDRGIYYSRRPNIQDIVADMPLSIIPERYQLTVGYVEDLQEIVKDPEGGLIKALEIAFRYGYLTGRASMIEYLEKQ